MGAEAPRSAWFAVVTGRVQGVGFRWSASDAARRLGVVGWVRNAQDGSVEVLAEGSPEALDKFLAWLRRGPPSARVEDVTVRPRQATGTFRSFEVEF